MDLVVQQDQEKSWVRYIQQRISRNKNFLGFLSGPTGSGKSWSSLSICRMVDDEFDISRIVFGGIELMDLINDGNLRKGSAICFEEVGVEMSSRNWQSITNKMLNFLIQTFRHRNIILLMNSPYMDFLDASTRRLMHAEFQTISIKDNHVRLKPQLIQYNSRMQKFYYKYLKVVTKAGAVPVSRWNIPRPSEALIKDYEIKKRKFTDSLNKRIHKELMDVNKKDKPGLTDVQQDIVDMLKEGNTIDKIALKRDRHPGVIYKAIELIKKKGYKIIPEYEGGRVNRYGVSNM